MNKKLIALAVAAAASAVPAAWAQTANPVTLYGRAYATVESIKDASASDSSRRTRIVDQASLLGVRGTEDLGGGIKAFFQLETSFPVDQTTSSFATRNSGVGFQGGFGSFIIGRWDMPFKTTTIAIDAFGDLTIGGITGANNDQGNFDRRDQNVAQYWSPNFGGFAVRLAATTRELATRDLGASVTFTRGPIYVVYAYEEHEFNATGAKEKGHALGANFRFGAFKIGALFERFEKPGRTDKESMLANLVWTLGKNQFIYQFQAAEEGDLLTSTAGDSDCDIHTAGYQYNFSKRTFLLAQYVRVNNDVGTNCNFGFGRQTLASGQDPRGVSVGLRHVF